MTVTAETLVNTNGVKRAQRTILITGASSGIGAALARQYASPAANLLLWGRNEERLAAVARDCTRAGATTEITVLDISDIGTMLSRLTRLDDQFRIELAILNAGIGGSLRREAISEEPAAAAFMASVNFTAPVAGANLLAGRMAGRGGGHIVFIGSVGGIYPLPMAPAYSGSKAGLAMFARALSLRVAKSGVALTLVAPGFIDTPMSQSLKEPRPFLISADAAAKILVRKLQHRPRKIVIPWQFAMITALTRFVPDALIDAFVTRF